jgi:hypothetical protein
MEINKSQTHGDYLPSRKINLRILAFKSKNLKSK